MALCEYGATGDAYGDGIYGDTDCSTPVATTRVMRSPRYGITRVASTVLTWLIHG